MKLTYAYRMALLSTEGKFSCLKCAENIEKISHDKLTRFLSNNDEKAKVNIKTLPKGGNLIVDDTPLSKMYAKNIEGIRWVYCSTLKKAIKGYTVIKIIYVHNNDIYNLEDIIWDKQEGTKNEIVRKKLKEYYEMGLEPEIILFDLWYGAKETFNLVNDFGWKYLCLSKRNRNFNGKRVDKHKYYGGKSLYGRAKGIGHIIQVVKHDKRYIMTNLESPIMSHSGWKIYQNRWIIETVFRDLKSFLHFEECEARTLQAQKNHISLCMDAYLFLKQKNPNKSIEASQRDFLQDFYETKFNNQDLFELVA
ncbi:MAG: transposase [Candidatus Gastranaerophilales bacterium]|nr:transposase [Candidatus Gastranaerophilales bacterium]